MTVPPHGGPVALSAAVPQTMSMSNPLLTVLETPAFARRADNLDAIFIYGKGEQADRTRAVAGVAAGIKAAAKARRTA